MPDRVENNWVHSLDIAFSSSATPLPATPPPPIVMAYGWARDTQDQPWTGGEQTTELISVGDTFWITIFETDQSDETKVRDDIFIKELRISVKDEHGRQVSPFNDAGGNNKGGSWVHTRDELPTHPPDNPNVPKVTGSRGCGVIGRSWWTPSYIVAQAGKFKITIDLVLSVGGTEKNYRVDPEVDIEGAG